MAGKIVADTLEHSTAGSLDTSYVVQGSAKAWVNFNGTGTIAARDSQNVSSLTDVGTGNYTVNFTNSMSSINYIVSITGAGDNDFTNTGSSRVTYTITSSSSCPVRTWRASDNSAQDSASVFTSIHGDLA